MSDDDVKLLIDTLSAAVAAGQKVSVPAERVLELHARLLVAQMEVVEVERATRSAERDSISMELALIPNIYKRHDFANAFSRGVNECRERIVDRELRAAAAARKG